MVALLPFSLLPGCGPDTENVTVGDDDAADATATVGDDDAADATAGESDTHDTPDCECIAPDSETVSLGSAAVPSAPTCGETLCATVRGSCGGMFEGYCGQVEAPFVLDDSAALECALVALRDRTPGVLTWEWSEFGGQFEESGYVLVRGDGTAVVRHWGCGDLVYDASDATLGPLRAAEDFTACLGEPDDAVRFDCLRDALASVSNSCDGGWTADCF